METLQAGATVPGQTLNATVLKAADREGLVKWFNSNGLVVPIHFEEWLAPYVERDWVITAFKVAPPFADGEGRMLVHSAVRMSFVTDRPVLPASKMRVPPEDQWGLEGVSMQVAVFAEERMEAVSLMNEKIPWPAKLAYASTSTPGVDPEDCTPPPRNGAVSAELWLKQSGLIESALAKHIPVRITAFHTSFNKDNDYYRDIAFVPSQDQSSFVSKRSDCLLPLLYEYSWGSAAENLAALIATALTAAFGWLLYGRARKNWDTWAQMKYKVAIENMIASETGSKIEPPPARRR